MRKTVPMRIGELWGDFVNSSPGVARRLAEARVAEVWAQVTGPVVAARTETLEVVKGILHVKMSSPAARHEIFLRREGLRDALNKAVGMDVLRSVIVK